MAYPYRDGANRMRVLREDRLHLAWPWRLMVAPARPEAQSYGSLPYDHIDRYCFSVLSVSLCQRDTDRERGKRGSMKHTELLFMVAMVAVAVYAIAQIFS